MKQFFLVLIFIFMPLVFIAAQEGSGTEQPPVFVTDSVQASPVSPVEPFIASPAERDNLVSDSKTDSDRVTSATAPLKNPILERIRLKEQQMNFFQHLIIALIIIAIQALLIRLVWKLFSHFSGKIEKSGKEKIKPFTIKHLKLLSPKQIVYALKILLHMLKYAVTAFQLFITVPMVFSLFPATRKFAETLFGYVFTPLKNIAIDAVKYIPNMITLIIIIVIARYAQRILYFFSRQITNGKLVIPGFYADWANPTFKMLQVLIWAFVIAIGYPYLPGSDSRVFQGVSVFVGIVFSLGSTNAIGNLVAGLVITYMRPFKIGDSVKIEEIIGFVVEKNMMVVRLKTHKNEYVTFPNIKILNTSVINYNTSSDEDADGLILNTEVSFGYATPWQTVHETLINAALATEHVQKKPKPFVLQTGMDDYYVRYQINCYTKEVDKVPFIYTRLYENIQDGFKEAGIDMTSPSYEVSVIKEQTGDK